MSLLIPIGERAEPVSHLSGEPPDYSQITSYDFQDGDKLLSVRIMRLKQGERSITVTENGVTIKSPDDLKSYFPEEIGELLTNALFSGRISLEAFMGLPEETLI